MKTKKLFTILTIFCLFCAANMCYGQTAEELYPKAVQLEEVKGELEEAIKVYETIVKDFPGEREYAAKALLRMGQCYEKLGKQDAEKVYNQLISEFSDQSEEVKKAQTLLAALKQTTQKSNSSQLVFTRVWVPALDDMGEPSPDERYISFTNWDNGNLAIHDTQTGKNWDITTEGIWGGELGDQFAMGGVWSPDEKKIAFTWWIDNSNGSDLRTVNADGSDLRILFKADNNSVDPMDWSPDGKYILAEKGRRDGPHKLVLINVLDGTVKELITLMETGYWGPDWRHFNFSFSPDGRYILYNRSDDINKQKSRIPVKSDIYLMDLKNFREVKLIDHPAEDIMPFWSPDGKKIAFLSNRTGTFDLWQVEVTDEKIVGEPRLILKNQKELHNMMKITKKGSLYFSKSFREGGDIYFASMDLNTGKLLSAPQKMITNFEGQNTEPALSPDGKYLAYFSTQGEKGKGIVIRSLVSGQERFLTNEFFINWRRGKPVWTPDGKSILAYKRDSIHPKSTLYAIDIETGKHSEFIKCKSNMHFSWSSPPFFSPDGKLFYYASSEEGKTDVLNQIEFKTGIEKKLRTADSYYLISPDGSNIAFVFGDGRKAWIEVMPASGGIAKQLVEFPFEEWPSIYSWSPDSKSLFYGKLSGDITELWKISATGGEPVKMELEMKGLEHFSIHPDGKQIVFECSKDWYAEIWKIDNLFADSK